MKGETKVTKCEECGCEMGDTDNTQCRKCYEKMVKESLDWTKKQ